jgi:hypothetical protein
VSVNCQADGRRKRQQDQSGLIHVWETGSFS